ncbi:MAG: hypothetical protein WCJ19_03840 [bacterium]
MRKRIHLTKKNKILILASVIFSIFLIFVIIIITYKEKTIVSSDLQLSSVKINNNIQTKINGITFNISDSNIVNNVATYYMEYLSQEQFNVFAKNLGMGEVTESKETLTARTNDSAGNSLEYSRLISYLSITNTNNPKLNDFNKDNALSKIQELSGINMSPYSQSDIRINDDKSMIISYKYSINGSDVVMDFNNYSVLKLYISSTGVLVKMSWDYINPVLDKQYDVIGIKNIKDNFFNIPYGVFPNIANEEYKSIPEGSYIEELAQYRNFSGRIDVNSVVLSYMWSHSNKDSFVPVYRFGGKFYPENGIFSDGVIIVPAIR